MVEEFYPFENRISTTIQEFVLVRISTSVIKHYDQNKGKLGRKSLFHLTFSCNNPSAKKSWHELKRGRNIKTETGEDVTNVY